MPAVTVLLFAVFRLLHVDVVATAAFQTSYERDCIIEDFNNDDEKAIVCLMTYAVRSTGLDMQHRCRQVHVVEAAYNLDAATQALGRVRRLENPSHVVYLCEYYVENTFDDRSGCKNIEKYIPEAMATLNQTIFNGGDESTGGLDVGE